MKIDRRVNYTIVRFDDIYDGDVFEAIPDGHIYMKVSGGKWNAVDLTNNLLAEIESTVAVRPFYDATLQIVEEEGVE